MYLDPFLVWITRLVSIVSISLCVACVKMHGFCLKKTH